LEAVMRDIDEAEADTFLDQFEVALTAHFGVAERNAYYGTVYVEFDRANLEWEPDRTEAEGLHFAARTFMTSIENHAIAPEILPALGYDPLLQLYADGLRAGSAESKFFHWFIILEEFLEKAKALNQDFSPLFDGADRQAVTQLAEQLGGRKRGNVLSILRSTEQNRAEKLAVILNRLGIRSVSAMGSSLNVTPELCESLIAQRNRLFHRGAHIDEGPLYTALFPIVTELAERSGEIMALREQG
jgi:hypothetical protein